MLMTTPTKYLLSAEMGEELGLTKPKSQDMTMKSDEVEE
jgi:hypothetical protein